VKYGADGEREGELVDLHIQGFHQESDRAESNRHDRDKCANETEVYNFAIFNKPVNKRMRK